MKVAGFGFRSGATEDSLRDALAQAGGAECFAVPEDKADHPAFAAFAAGHKVVAVPQSAMEMADTLTQSPKVQALRGTGSVAEACALVAAGPGARLCGRRLVSTDHMATCAIAEGETT